MAHPKRRSSNHRTRIRRSHIKLEAPQLNACARCGATHKPHTVCENCGYYGFAKGSDKRGREVLERDEF